MKRRAVVGLLTALVAVAALRAYLRRDYRPEFSRAAGTLVDVRDSTGAGTALDGKRLVDLTLVGDTGLQARVRIRAADDHSGARHPAAILIGGWETGRAAADVPPETADLVLVSLDYPYDGPSRPTWWQWITHFGQMRQAVLDTPPALLLAAQYLYGRDDVDPDRVTVIGVSLGVPFATATAATDRRLAGAALLHGGADLRGMAAYAWADDRPAWLVWLQATGVAWAAAPLEPGRYVGAIAPRPVLLIEATGDELVPRRSALALYRAAREPKRLVWLASGHVQRSNEEVVDELMRVTLEWMEERGLR